MATRQLLIRLPDDLVRRLKRRVPARARSAFVQRLLEQALPEDEGEGDPLYQAALAVERDDRLTTEMAEWDVTIADGLRRPRRRANEPFGGCIAQCATGRSVVGGP